MLKEYVGNFHPRLIGLTGSEAEIRAAARAFKVHRAKVIPRDDAGKPAKHAARDYLVSHSSLLFLMGPDGKFLTLIPHGAPPERFTTVLKKYLIRG